ncbi:metallophosphoesterase [Alkaliphilus oremlandii]|uniref:Metallophosphoesterase n=1 Tax=Alkaliphilus oremlandii (strain OhILAs) TaxID=350688 RepID=A8MKG0_ALKOO|nr:metallophosphoesterase [Alkaliphilus oremlandii]ABW20292.1 metallophosphoesterase [Alkaliphilus oremlandii OhILAs]
MNLKVKKMTFHKNRRIIAISDIHGNLALFKGILEKVHYTKEDVLVLLGDLIEKGENSLETLRSIMELSNEQEVHIVTGNCDAFIWEYIKYGTNDEDFLKYMLFRRNSILNEMCKHLGIDVNEQSDMKFIKKQLREHFAEELSYLEKFPHIIETEDYIFAHAGIATEDLAKNKVDEVVKQDAFMNKGLNFSKYVIVGHWPTVNYGIEKGCCNPIINRAQKIISIDGGNTIKEGGQLNALIIKGDDITFDSIDDLPQGEIIEAQEANKNTIQITWMDNSIDILKIGEEFSLCRHGSSGHDLLIKNDKIFKSKDGMRCYDCTDYFIEAEKGDRVSIIEKANEITLVKKNGTIGWVQNKNIRL